MTKDIALLAAGLAAGTYTEEMIENELGDGILCNVLAFVGGSVAGTVTAGLVHELTEDTIIDDVFYAVDDIFDSLF
jgi:uncharacterized membrane protein YeaQ/YmgE (transglycosylase-associated protein family)